MKLFRLPFALALYAILAAALLAPGQALARHPDPSDMYKVKKIARELEREARYLHRTAEAYAHHGDRAEAHALSKLHSLEDAADHFYDQVRRYQRNPYHTARDYQRLVRAWNGAYHSMDALHGFRHVERRVYEVAGIMDALHAYYVEGGRYDPQYERYDGYGRHERYDDHRGHGRYRGHGAYRGHGRYRGHGNYRDPRRDSHYRDRDHHRGGYGRDRDRNHHRHDRSCGWGKKHEKHK